MDPPCPLCRRCDMTSRKYATLLLLLLTGCAASDPESGIDVAQGTEAPPPLSLIPNEQLDAATYRARAAEAYRAGDHDSAIADYSAALRMEPDAPTHFLRGVHLSAKKLHDLAISDYTAAIQRDEKFAPAYFNRG